MIQRILLTVLYLCALIVTPTLRGIEHVSDLSRLQSNQILQDFSVRNLYSDPNGNITGAKFLHIATGTPIFLLQIETVPQMFMWVDTPADSDQGLQHSLEHLLAGKGTKGRYIKLLNEMRLSPRVAVTINDFNFYAFSSGTGMGGFDEQLHAWLDALFASDFSDVEAEREFFHFGVTKDGTIGKRTLVEEGSVYNEMQSHQGSDDYYYELKKLALGEHNPFGFQFGGVPDAMRSVTPADIRGFYTKYYHLGPRTGFIFAISPKEDIQEFLRRVSEEFRRFPVNAAPEMTTAVTEPKYPIRPSESKGIKICSFPSGRDTDPGQVRLGWAVKRAESAAQLKLVDLLFRALVQGQQALLYKSLVDSRTRELDSGAKTLDFNLYLDNSPYFPLEHLEIAGIPGNRITPDLVDKLRDIVRNKFREISEYPEDSSQIKQFNQLVLSYAKASHRSETIWIKSPPLFGRDYNKDWKDHFGLLEMDHAFVKSLSEEPVWKMIEQELRSSRNIWRELIQQFGLLEVPYATAAKPSTQLLADIENNRENRLRKKIDELRNQYHSAGDQQALARFEKDELIKSKQVDEIEAKVSRPHFSKHPPLTKDDDIRYRELQLSGVPVIASLFDRPPTIDIGIAFDLRTLPRKYYKYLPIFPRCFDSLGLRRGEQVIPYATLLTEIHEKIPNFSIGYEYSPISKRADLVFRAAASDVREFRTALHTIGEILRSNNLDISTTDRLRDIVDQNISADESFTKRDELSWTQNPPYAFWNQENPLFLALASQFTQAHWNERLKWLLHRPLDSKEKAEMATFIKAILFTPSNGSANVSFDQLRKSDLTLVQQELADYWQRNLSSFPEDELPVGLQRLADEVQRDLATSPNEVVKELKELQQIALSRHRLHLDLTLAPDMLDEIRPDLIKFIRSLPSSSGHTQTRFVANDSLKEPLTARLEKRYGSSHVSSPLYVAFANADGVTDNIIVYSQFPGYSHTDHELLIRLFSSKLLAGMGPGTIYSATRSAGLAYTTWILSDPSLELQSYYADHVSDVPALINLVNASVGRIPDIHDPLVIDSALRQIFSIPRTVLLPSQRGAAIARDLRDGNDPGTIRRFSEAILRLRQEPDLLAQLTQVGLKALCPILLQDNCKPEQVKNRSVFFFIGPEKALSDFEKRLPIPKLLRLWPSDYWLE